MAFEPSSSVVAMGASPWGLWADPHDATLICAACSSEMPPEAAFCGECGVRLERPVDEDVSTEAGDDIGGSDHDAAAPPGTALAELVDVDPTAPPETADLLPALRPATVAKRRRRGRAPVLVGIAAAAAVLVGVILTSGGSDNDDSVIAADVSTTITTEARSESHTDGAGGTDTTDPDAPAPGDNPEVATDDAATTATTAAGDTNTAGVGAPASSAPAFWDADPVPPDAPPPPPAPPPPTPTTTAPPPPAALSASSSCSPTCVIPRGGSFEISVMNSGGRSGTFTVTASDGLQANPSQGSVSPGKTRTIDIVDTLGKRRPDVTVEVRGPDGQVIFTATFAIRG